MKTNLQKLSPFPWNPSDDAYKALLGGRYHLNNITKIIDQGYVSKESEDVSFVSFDSNVISWEIRAFFVEIYSISDLMLQFANVECELGLMQNQVRWTDLSSMKAKSSNPTRWLNLKTTLTKLMKEDLFTQIASYRHYSHQGMLEANYIPLFGNDIRSSLFLPPFVGGKTYKVESRLEEFLKFMWIWGNLVFHGDHLSGT